MYLCQRLNCTTTNQPLSGRDGALKAADSGVTGGYKASYSFCQGCEHPCLWMCSWNAKKQHSNVTSAWLIFQTLFPQMACFHRMPGGINVTVSDWKRQGYGKKFIFIKKDWWHVKLLFWHWGELRQWLNLTRKHFINIYNDLVNYQKPYFDIGFHNSYFDKHVNVTTYMLPSSSDE